MGARAYMYVEIFIAGTGVWEDITRDTVAPEGLRLKYGVNGNGPTDCVASSGECAFALNNDASNADGTQGAYSLDHPITRVGHAGWALDVPCRVVFHAALTANNDVTSITRASQTATVTCAANHGLATGDYVRIAGAVETEYNGVYQVTVTGATTFTYTVVGTPSTPATGTITQVESFIKHRGKISVIDADPGQYRSQRVHVVSYDGIRDLAEVDVREIALQIDKTESELVAAVLAALPTDAQQVATDLDAGEDTIPYAFHDLGEGQKALGVIHDLCKGSFAFFANKGDGTSILRSRASRNSGSSAFSISNTMHGLRVPSSRQNVFNRVRIVVHPKTISAAATEELYTLPSNSSFPIAPGQTLDVWTEYSDPNDRQTPVGGTEIVTVLVANTHYQAFANADGSGSNLTADISATLTPYATTAKWTLTNNGAQTAHMRVLKVIGKVLRDLGSQTVEDAAHSTDSARPLNLDLKYQGDVALAQSYAEFLNIQFQSVEDQVEYLEFLANDSAALLAAAFEREPGDIITVTEEVTGLSAVDAVIHSVEFEVAEGPAIRCKWGLAPATPFTSWAIGIVNRSEIGETTFAGF